jgi:2-oxoglutarate dehydrogenase complex dehydrogenase (E1) component-like enzyme
VLIGIIYGMKNIKSNLEDIKQHLQKIYSGFIGAEFNHLTVKK